MERLKRVLAASGLVAAVVACGLTAPAHATGVKAVCTFIADLKMQDKLDPALGMRLVGGKGSARFTPILMVCIHSGKAGFEILSTTATASGTYENVVCGTDKFVATIETTGDAKLDLVLKGEKFAIETVGFSGPFYWHDWDKPTLPDLKQPPPNATKPSQAKTWQVAGSAHLLPPQDKLGPPPDLITGHCTKAFTVVIVMTIHHF